MATRRNPGQPASAQGALSTVTNTGGLGDTSGWKTKTVPLDEFFAGNYRDWTNVDHGEGYSGAVGPTMTNMQGVWDAYASGGNMADALTKDNRYGNGIQYDPKTGMVTYKYDDSGSSFGGLAQEFFTSPGFLMPASFGLATAFAPAGLAGLGVEAGAIPALEGATAGAAGGLGGVTGAVGGATAADLAALGELGINTDLLAPEILQGITPGSLSNVTPPTGFPDINTPPTGDRGGHTPDPGFEQGGGNTNVTPTPNVPAGVQPGTWSRIINGNGTIDDFAKIFGGIAPAVMGWFASNQNTEALENFTNQWMDMGKGYRDQLANLYTEGGMEAWANSPQVQTTLDRTLEGAARALSVEGNPALNPFAQNTMRDEGLNKMWEMLTGEKQFLATAGGLGSFNAAAPNMALASVNSNNNAWNAIGSGLSSVLNPQPSLEELFALMQQYGINNAGNIGTIR